MTVLFGFGLVQANTVSYFLKVFQHLNQGDEIDDVQLLRDFYLSLSLSEIVDEVKVVEGSPCQIICKVQIPQKKGFEYIQFSWYKGEGKFWFLEWIFAKMFFLQMTKCCSMRGTKRKCWSSLKWRRCKFPTCDVSFGPTFHSSSTDFQLEKSTRPMLATTLAWVALQVKFKVKSNPRCSVRKKSALWFMSYQREQKALECLWVSIKLSEV